MSLLQLVDVVTPGSSGTAISQGQVLSKLKVKGSLLALNALKLEGSIRGTLRRAGWNDQPLARFLCQPPHTKVKCDSRVTQ